MHKWKASILVIVGFTGLLPLLISQPTDLGDVERKGDRDRIAITVESSNPEVQQLARKAFGVHGGYTVVANSAQALFGIRIEPAGSGVNLVIGSGNPFREQVRRQVSGANLRDGVLRACDAAVEATSGNPGFFAGRLAFVGKQRGVTEIYTSDLFFNNVRKMTNDGALVVGPRWSPDGMRILYTSYFKSGFPDIFQIDLRSGHRTPFASFKGTNTGATFSPDGRNVAMSLSAGGGNTEIFVSDASGRSIKRLTNNKSLEASPSWSPDGSRLVFTSDRPGKPRLYEISAQGGPMRAIPTNISNYCSEPHWNPRKPNLIVFSAAMGRGFQIAVYDFTTNSSKVVSNVPGDAVEPYWLRDGRHVVFTNRIRGRKNLMILDIETGKARALHSPAFGDASHASFVY